MNNNIYALKGYERASDFPLDKDALFANLELATQYVRYSKTCYPGQIISVIINESKTKVFIVQYNDVSNEDGFTFCLEEVGTGLVLGAKYKDTVMSTDILYSIDPSELTEGDVYYVRRTNTSEEENGTGRGFYSAFYWNGSDWIIKDIHLNIADETTDGLMRMEIFNSLISKRESHALFYSNSDGVIDNNSWVDMEVVKNTFTEVVDGNLVSNKLDPRDIFIDEDKVILSKSRFIEMMYEMTSPNVDSDINLKLDNFSHWIISNGIKTVNINGEGQPIKQITQLDIVGEGPIETELSTNDVANITIKLNINESHLKINSNGSLAHKLNFDENNKDVGFYKFGFDDAGHLTSVVEVDEEDLLNLLTLPTSSKKGILNNLDTVGKASLDTRFYSDNNSWDKIPYELFECNRTYYLDFQLNNKITTKNIPILNGTLNRITIYINEQLSDSVTIKMREVAGDKLDIFTNDDVWAQRIGSHEIDLMHKITNENKPVIIVNNISDEDQEKTISLKIEYYGRDINS